MDVGGGDTMRAVILYGACCLLRVVPLSVAHISQKSTAIGQQTYGSSADLYSHRLRLGPFRSFLKETIVFRKLTALESYIGGVLRSRGIKPPHPELTPKYHQNRWCWVNDNEEVHGPISDPCVVRVPGSQVPGYDHR